MTDLEVMKRIYKPVKDEPKIVVMNIINAICGGLLPLIGIFTLTIISRELLSENVNLDSVLTRIVYILSLGLLLSIGEVVTQNLTYVEFNQLRAEKFGHLVKKITTMDFNRYEDVNFMDRVNSVVKGVQSNNIGVEGVYHKVFELGKFLITGVALMVIISKASIYIIGIILIALTCEYFFNQNIAKYKFSKREKLANIDRKAKFYATSASDFTYGKDMRTYSVEGLFSTYYNRENENFKMMSKLFRKREISLSFGQVLAIVLADILSLIVLMKSVGTTIDITQFIFYMSSVTVLMVTLRRIFLDISNIKENTMYAREVYLFLEDDLITEGGREIDFNGEPIELKFENVSFAYPGSERNVFNNISFTINSGESIALVGVNGAGKTSLVKLITGLYEPDSGNIYYNGINAKEFTKESRYKLFATVFQDVNPIAFTIAQNVSSELDADRIDRDKVIKTLDEVGLLEKVQMQEHGIDSIMLKIIDENGVVLSGGENQKLLIAKALYKENTSMLILDEPTAALDALEEEKIYRELEEIMSGRTTLFISHRLASTKFCDRIVLLSGGEIVEDGTHDELMELEGLYHEMYEVQGKYYKEVER